MSCIFLLVCILFKQKKWFQILAIFCTYPNVHYIKTSIGFALSVSGQRLFIPMPMGHLLWSLLSMKGINIGDEKMSAFPHYSC